MKLEYSSLLNILNLLNDNYRIINPVLNVSQALKIDNIYNNPYLYSLYLQLLKTVCLKKPQILQ
jgi:hypothetical protein